MQSDGSSNRRKNHISEGLESEVVPVIPSKCRIFRFTQYVSAFGFSSQSDDPLLQRSLLD
jgi:hypothetical protein